MSRFSSIPAQPARALRRLLVSPAAKERRRNPEQNRFIPRTCIVTLLVGSIGLSGIAPAVAGRVCKPTLTVTNAKLSEMQPPMLERRWTAVVSADTRRCATTTGHFEMAFSREKENGLKFEFHEQLIWSAPSVMVGVGFWADEAVETYRIESVQPCPCAK